MKIKTEEINSDYPKTTSYCSELCECGRLYKDRMSNGKMMCSACYLNCDVEQLKKLWGNPVNKE